MAKAFNPISLEWRFAGSLFLLVFLCFHRSPVGCVARSGVCSSSLNTRVQRGWTDDVSRLSKAGRLLPWNWLLTSRIDFHSLTPSNARPFPRLLPALARNRPCPDNRERRWRGICHPPRQWLNRKETGRYGQATSRFFALLTNVGYGGTGNEQLGLFGVKQLRDTVSL